jgi:hypothetical protein
MGITSSGNQAMRAIIVVTVALLGIAPTARLAAQATNPPYLAEMPPVERILREIKGAAADETAARQMGTFLQFKDIIEKMASYRFYRNQLTPDEKRLIGVYYAAYWDIAKTRPEYQKFTGLKGFDIDRSYRAELFQRFFSASFRARYEAVDSEFKRNIAARARADTANMMRTRAEVAEYEQRNSPKPWQRALARCIASGRSESQCTSEGLVKDFKGMFGAVLPGGRKSPVGLRLSGVFTVQSGLGITFWDAHAVVACGQLVADERAYTVELRNGQVVVGVRKTPELRQLVDGPSSAVLLTLGADGRLTGPGPTEITGRVVIGERTWTRVYDDGRKVPMSEPVYQWRTVRCNLGAMAFAGPAPAIGTVSEGLTTGINLMTSILGGQDATPLKPAPPGLRLSGEYGSQAAFDLEFNPRGVVVGCGDAVVARDYTVKLQGGLPVVSIQHGSTPFAVTLQPDGTLNGSGSVVVDGRVIVGEDPNGGLAFAPRTGTCPIGVLALAGQPQSAGGGGNALTAGGAAGGGAAAAGAASASTITAAATPGNAVLSLQSGLPTPAGGANPLGGRGFYLLKGGAESALSAAGVRAPAGTSAANALATTCGTREGECRQALMGIIKQAIGVLTADGTGRGQFPGVAPGTYTVFGMAVAGDQGLLWLRSIELKAGTNPLVLDQRSAVTIKN